MREEIAKRPAASREEEASVIRENRFLYHGRAAARMNPILSEMLATRRVQTREGSVVPLDSEISMAEGAALQGFILARRPRVTLEVGCAFGVSTLFICEALAEVGGQKHIVIDPHQEHGWKGLGLYNTERAGFGSLIEFHGESSHRVLPALEAAGERVGVALIDGWHTFDYAMVDFFFVDRLLDTGGIVVLDDTAAYPAVRKLARYVATHRRYEVADTSAGTTPGRWLSRAVSGALSSFPMRRLARRLVRPEILRPDSVLGLPPGNFIAFRKIANDILGDGAAGTRRWDQHGDF
jgi:predicted O-methyltransferase YrrM